MDPEVTVASTDSPYKKVPVWVWIIVYLIIGGVVYAGIYYFYLGKKTPYSATPSTTQNESPSPTGENQVIPTVTTENPPATSSAISWTDAGFAPAQLIVPIGTKVSWTNTGATTSNVSSAPHPAHTAYPPLNLGNFASGESVFLVFDTPGTYKYHNHLNPTQFGSITVQ